MTSTELYETHDSIVTVPRPRRHIRIAMLGLLALISLYVVLFAGSLYELLTHAPSAGQNGTLQRLVSDAMFAAMLSLVLGRGFLDWNRPLVISERGIDLRGFNLPWERIVSCRWNHYSRDTLVIAISQGKAHTRQTVSIPDSHRTLVEETLRRFGKWGD